MDSILQKDSSYCYKCGRNGATDPLDWHHVFEGTANRRLSEKYGLKVRLCHMSCHEYGKNAVHKDKNFDTKLKVMAQKKFEETHAREEFMTIFGRNFIMDDTEEIEKLPWE